VAIELAVLFGLACAAYTWGRQVRHPVPAGAFDWVRIAREAGVTHLVEGGRTFAGRDGGLGVEVEMVTEEQAVVARIQVSGLAPEIAIVRNGLGGRDLLVGDPSFDADLAASSSNALVARALLDAATRDHLREAFAAGRVSSVGAGTLKASLTREIGRSNRFDTETFRALLDLAHRLEPVDDAEERLVRVAGADPQAVVRARAIATLVECAPGLGPTRAAVRGGLLDAAPIVRLWAARAGEDEGVSVLQALATDPDGDDAIGAEAVAALGTRLPVGPACEAVVRAAGGRRLRTGEAAVEILAGLGGAAVERALVAALDASTSSFAEAAARALGRCGGVAVIPDLARAEGRRGSICRAAREAIAAIQSRLTGASPGQVALADGDAGELSVVDATDGRVSLKANGGSR
jgi:hypothetical protein